MREHKSTPLSEPDLVTVHSSVRKRSFQKAFHFFKLLKLGPFSPLAPAWRLCELNGIHSWPGILREELPCCLPRQRQEKCRPLAEGRPGFWDRQAIGSDRDEEGRSRLPFTNMDNYTEHKAVERLRKFSRSLGSFPELLRIYPK